MEAQTQSTPEGQEPTTPVIIKTGSNKGIPPEVVVCIESLGMTFTKFVPDPTGEAWVAHSTRSGRISQLIMFENIELKPGTKKQPYPEELASIRIEYGPAQSLVLSETLNPDKDVVLEIRSEGVSFKETTEDWNTATATFLPLSRMVFMGRNELLVNREFIDTKVAPTTLTISFPKPTVG